METLFYTGLGPWAIINCAVLRAIFDLLNPQALWLPPRCTPYPSNLYINSIRSHNIDTILVSPLISKTLTIFLQIRIILLELAFNRLSHKPRLHQERNTSRIYLHLCKCCIARVTLTRFNEEGMETGDCHNRRTLPRKLVWGIFLSRNEMLV